MSGKPSSTVSFEKRWNPLLSRSKEVFIAAVVDVPPKPEEMTRILAANRGLDEPQP